MAPNNAFKGAIEKIIRVILIVILLGMPVLSIKPVLGWSNGGYSDDPLNPDYGTHDWIAQHALDWLPTDEKQYILDNLATYLYGTELPDNSLMVDGIGDTTKHHVYFYTSGSLQDDASAVRAFEEYQKALNFLKAYDYTNAAKSAGITSHYIVDVAVFGHVMGANTAWGAEVHHTDYEDYVNARTTTYSSSFDSYLHFDGSLTVISSYDAAKNLAYDTTFDVDGDLTCVWMDTNCNWSNPTFANRCGESLNLAVNYLADVLHSLYLASTPSPSPSPSPTPTLTPTPTPSPSPTPTPTSTPSPLPSTDLNPSPSPAIPEMAPLVLIIALAVVTTVVVLSKKKKALSLPHC